MMFSNVSLITYLFLIGPNHINNITVGTTKFSKLHTMLTQNVTQETKETMFLSLKYCYGNLNIGMF